jgi:hypothetical protein
VPAEVQGLALLRHRPRLIGDQRGQQGLEQPRPLVNAAADQGDDALPAPDREMGLREDRAGVEAALDHVPGDPVRLLAPEDRPGAGMDAAIAGQRAVVEIDRAALRYRQAILAEDAEIVDADDIGRPCGPHGGEDRRIIEVRGIQIRNAGRTGGLLQPRLGNLPARVTHAQNRLGSRLARDQPKDVGGHLSAADENKPHPHHSPDPSPYRPRTGLSLPNDLTALLVQAGETDSETSREG